MGEKAFKVGLYRRIFNKNLKDALNAKGFNYTLLREKTGIVETVMSEIVNFKHNPNETQRVSIAIALGVPIDDLFPEKYDELYDRISPASRSAEIKIDFLQLSSPEVLALEAPDHADDEAIFNERREKLKFELKGLPYKETRVLEMRFGLGDGEWNHEHTLEETARKMGVSRERIRQIEAKALERLRTKTHLKEFTP